MGGNLSLADLLGALSGVFFAVPPLKDQYRRWNENKPVVIGLTAKLTTRLVNLMKEKRNGFSGIDTVMLLLGSILLCLSFIVKSLGEEHLKTGCQPLWTGKL